MRDALLDLVLGSVCAVCGSPGRLLCRPCEAALPRVAWACHPTPCPPGLVTPLAVGEYAGPLKLLVNAHKERHQLALARPLGELLACAVRGHVSHLDTAPLLVVPVPSRRAVGRSRGHDPLTRLTRRATAALRRGGVRATLAPLLVGVGAVTDQAGLGADERRRNLAGTIAVREALVRRVGRSAPGGLLVVVDDVVTTGTTLREAQRALESAGMGVHGAAVVAATRRWHPPGLGGDSASSLPFSAGGD